LFILNLKSYPAVLGSNAERIGKKLQKVSREFGVPATIAPAPVDVGRLSRILEIPVIAQHVDSLGPGAHTGFTVPEAVRIAGGRGSLLNHSEHPISPSQVGRAVRLLRVLGLVAVVCAKNPRIAATLASFHPPYLAVEPPELIGTGRSVSQVRPEVIYDAVRAVRNVSRKTRVLCGAGVTNRSDVRKALELESEGVLVASAVALAPSPEKALRELFSGFRHR
jgi:triosephosphate isomerase